MLVAIISCDQTTLLCCQLDNTGTKYNSDTLFCLLYTVLYIPSFLNLPSDKLVLLFQIEAKKAEERGPRMGGGGGGNMAMGGGQYSAFPVMPGQGLIYCNPSLYFKSFFSHE